LCHHFLAYLNGVIVPKKGGDLVGRLAFNCKQNCDDVKRISRFRGRCCQCKQQANFKRNNLLGNNYKLAQTISIICLALFLWTNGKKRVRWNELSFLHKKSHSVHGN
jgi:hypothetical protein